MSIYNFTVTSISGEESSLEQFKGKVILIVNTASKCGLTPQYKGLQDLYEQYHDQGFEILGFPCNQFGGQEPGTHAEIQEFCQVNYAVTFPLFSKIDVNGPNTDPLYQYLKGQQQGDVVENTDIQWNFTKFLVDQNGQLVKRFEPKETPAEIEPEISRLLNR